jgi:DNA modification methylase
MKHQTGHLNLKPSGGDLISETYLMDCILGMKEYPDKYFDLAVVDPPYKEETIGLSAGFNRKHFNYETLNTPPTVAYINELFRVSKNQIMWGFNYYLELLPNTDACIIWNKHQNGHFSEAELAWSSLGKTRIFDRAYQKDIGNKIHPTQKPVELYDWIFLNYAEPNQKILDTHLGSGSSRIAAHKNGLHFVGFEIDEEYFYMQEGRFEKFLRSPTLFSTPRAVGVLNSNAPTLNFEQSTEL